MKEVVLPKLKNAIYSLPYWSFHLVNSALSPVLAYYIGNQIVSTLDNIQFPEDSFTNRQFFEAIQSIDPSCLTMTIGGKQSIIPTSQMCDFFTYANCSDPNSILAMNEFCFGETQQYQNTENNLNVYLMLIALGYAGYSLYRIGSTINAFSKLKPASRTEMWDKSFIAKLYDFGRTKWSRWLPDLLFSTALTTGFALTYSSLSTISNNLSSHISWDFMTDYFQQNDPECLSKANSFFDACNLNILYCKSFQNLQLINFTCDKLAEETQTSYDLTNCYRSLYLTIATMLFYNAAIILSDAALYVKEITPINEDTKPLLESGKKEEARPETKVNQPQQFDIQEPKASVKKGWCSIV